MNISPGIASIVGSLLGLGACCTPAIGSDVRIEHVTIVSPERTHPMRDATVYIEDGRIASIEHGAAAASSSPARSVSATVVDGRGLYLAPGLIDSHVHVSDIPGMTAEQEQAHRDLARAAREQVPKSYLYFGFTTLVDLISTPMQVDEWNAHNIRPDLHFCGAAPLLDGYPMNWIPKPQRYEQFPYLVIEKGDAVTAPAGLDPAKHTPEAVVARIKADGALCVKTVFERGFGQARDLPVPRLETIQALVRAAHAAGMPVYLHANGSEAQEFALDAGVDIIAHGLWRWNGERPSASDLTPGVKALLDRIASARIGWQPTIQVLYGELELFNPTYLSDPRLRRVLPPELIAWYASPEGQWFRNVLASGVLPRSDSKANDAAEYAVVRSAYRVPIERNVGATAYLAKQNARLLFGSDTPSAPTYANPPGLNGWIEMRRLVEAGLTPAQVFRAATLSNAEALGLQREIGSITVGKSANLLLLRENPQQHVDAYDEITKVIVHGEIFDRADLAADRGQN